MIGDATSWTEKKFQAFLFLSEARKQALLIFLNFLENIFFTPYNILILC